MADEQLETRFPLRFKVLALLGAPLAWTLHLFLGYLAVALGCTTGWTGTAVVIAVLTVLLAAAAIAVGWIALRSWRQVQHATSWEHAVDEAGGHEGLLFLVGVFLAALFTLLILMNGVAPFVVPICAS